jgi:hypothetical protein
MCDETRVERYHHVAMRALHVIGVLDMVPTYDAAGTHEIDAHPLAGFAAGITNWKGTRAFVVLEDLSPEDLHRVLGNAARYFRGLGEAAYRASAAPEHPRVAELVSRARLAPLPGDLDPKGPYRVVEVGFQRNADDYFHCAVWREDVEIVDVGGPLSDIVASCDVTFDRRTFDDERFVDRLLRAATSGLVSCAQVGLAFDIAESESDLDEWEASLARRDEDRSLAVEIAALLASATGDVAVVSGLGDARRVTLPKVTVSGEVEIVLPEEHYWTAIAEPDAVVAPATKRRERTPPLALAVLFGGAVLLLIAFLMSRR